ncbi:hypothetical protein SAMN05444413_101334 [Roseivivax marinus]|uniref:hypothetical protein n=1 Tax=Roseivivax marinus TaxID=1379903 RepID=UPI0008B09314|nr:hypothetical protein [Roseivivax marinus]SEK32856.1 hypothetical protein SAMN05444413_101334 [Roseivivax marinus]
MTRTVLPLTLLCLALALPGPAAAACYADYKAKQEDPLRLHYGVAELPDDACSRGAAADALRARLADAGWTLLNVVSTFGGDQLDEKRDSAGENFLRY